MTRSSLWLQPFVLTIVGVLAAWAVDSLPTPSDLKLPIPSWGVLLLAVVASFALNVLPLLWGESTPADRQATSRSWISCLSPLVASGVLFFLVHAGHIPQSMVASCLYASLVLFVVAAILPPVLALKTQRQARAAFQTGGQFSSLDADVTNRNRLLNAISIEVEGRIRSAFHNRVRLMLGKEALPAEVQPPWDQEVKDRNQVPIAIDPGTSILSIFEQPEIAGGKLLILGNPGSGKTTALLELAKALIDRARGDVAAPIPVVLGLSSWQGSKQKFSTWFLSELDRKYTVQRAIGQRWLDEGKLLPLLDGLDEVAPESQIDCVRAINLFRREFGIDQLAVCSRIEEYQQLQVQLELNAAVYLQPLKSSQIREYCLRTVGTDLWNAVQANSDLLDLVKTPFFMGIVSVVWQTISQQTDWQQAQSQGEQQNLLLDAYIRQRLDNTNARQAKSVRRWLAWLAKNLQQHNPDEFLIEELQPNWLMQKRLEWFYRVVAGLSVGLIHGLIYVPVFVLGVVLSVVLSDGLTFVLSDELSVVLSIVLDEALPYEPIFELILGLRAALFNISPRESLMNWSWEETIAALGNALIFWLGGALILFFLVANSTSELSFGLTLFGIAGLIFRLSKSRIQTRTIPNQGIKASATNSLILGLSFVLILVLVGEWRNGLLCGPFVALMAGGIAVIQHVTLRLFLSYKHYAPWNYAKFLNHATDDLILLQRVGGGYRFIHALLRTRFAEICDEEEMKQ